jgi:hypothetical protein
MPWTKLSDDYSDDLYTFSHAAFRLHTEAIIWSNRKLLDMRVPKADLRRFATDESGLPEILERGFWKAEGDAYVIVHHAGYQRKAEKVINQQAVNKENRAKAGKEARPPREQSVSFTPSKHDSSDDSSDELDRTGQAVTEAGTSAAEVAVDTATGEVDEGEWSSPGAVERPDESNTEAFVGSAAPTAEPKAYEWVREGNRRVKRWVA